MRYSSRCRPSTWNRLKNVMPVGNVVSLRQFSVNVFNHHHGMQAEERFGVQCRPRWGWVYKRANDSRQLWCPEIMVAGAGFYVGSL